MSLFSKVKKKRKSASAEIAVKSESRSKSTPQVPSGIGRKSYSKSKSNDPDITLGLSNLSLKSGDEESKFNLVSKSAIDVDDEWEMERSYTPHALSKAKPLQGATKSAPSSKLSYGNTKSKTNEPQSIPDATKSAPSILSSYKKAKSVGKVKAKSFLPSYSTTGYEPPDSPPVNNKTKAAKSTTFQQDRPHGKLQAKSKASSGFQKSDNIPAQFNQDEPVDELPPSSTEAVDWGDMQETPHKNIPQSWSSHPFKSKGLPDQTMVSASNLPETLPPAPKQDHLPLQASSSESPATRGVRVSVMGKNPSLDFDFVSTPERSPPPPPKPPTLQAAGLATELHFEMVAEELSPADLPGLCRHLGLTVAKVEQIQYDNRHVGFQEQVIAILNEWKKKAGRQVTLKALLQSLKKSGNTSVANIIEDRLNIKGDVMHEIQGSCSPEESLKQRLDYHAMNKFERTMSELKKIELPDNQAYGQERFSSEPKFTCPKCSEGYENISLLQYHVDACIEDLSKGGKSKMQTSTQMDEQASSVSIIGPNKDGSMVDDATIMEVASELQSSEWQQLAYHLGFLQHAIQRFEKRGASYTPKEQTLVMLYDWRRKQKTDVDMMYELSEALRNCGLPHLTTLADNILKQERSTHLKELKAAAESRYSPVSANIDDTTLRQMSSQLGRDWKKLAHHLGYSKRAVQRLQGRRSDYNQQEQALYMLTDWQRRQTSSGNVHTNTVGNLAKALHKCGERHLAELAEWLRRQTSTKTAEATAEQEKPLSSPKGKSSGGSHIMISYQWDSQKQTLELKDQLTKAGYSVWIDVDKMGGDLLGSMSEAVENAAVVIICVSKKYKESVNCQAEASYAFQLKKPIIPVIMDKSYTKPDGWLGMVISMRLYYRMYNAEVIKEDLPALINDLGAKGRSYQHSISFTARPTPSSVASFDLTNKCKAVVYLCDPQSELIPYADVWVTMFLEPSLSVFRDETSRSLLTAGGDKLFKSIRALKAVKSTPVKTGTVIRTPPGDLPCQEVFHIVYKENVLSSGYLSDLKSAFSECMVMAQHKGSSSIAFSLFTDQEALKFNTAVEQAVATARSMSENVEDSLKRVLFVTQKPSVVKKISNELYNVTSSIANRPVKMVYCRSRLYNGTLVTVANGNIILATTDAIVVSVSSSYHQIGLCGSVYKAGGPTLQAEYNKYTMKNKHKPGTAFKIGSGQLPCREVIYAVVPTPDVTTKDSRKDLLDKSLKSSLTIADADNCESVTVPSIGSNSGNLMETETADVLVNSVLEYFEANPSSNIKEVLFLDTNARCCAWLKKSLAGRVSLGEITEDSPDGFGQTGEDKETEPQTEIETEMEIEETPAEILARGPAAQQAYLEAARDGTKPVHRTRLMLVGQERVGKTSLMKNLSGQSFDATEIITDGVDASTVCEIPGDSAGPWKLQDTLKDLANHVQSQYTEALCTLMAQRLTELSEQHVESADEEQEKEELLELLSQITDLKFEDEQTEEEPKLDDPPTIEDDLEADSAPMSEDEDVGTEEQSIDHEMNVDTLQESETEKIQAAKSDVSVPDAILKKLRQVLKEKKQELKAEAKKGVQEFQIWDFAGQDVYYTTHQVFLSNRAIYMVVFDLRLDLNKPVTVEVFHHDKVQSRFHDFTGLEFLNFWMQSIYAYATSSNQQIPAGDRPQLSPPIFIVGTHRESSDISPDPEERKRLVTEKFQSISDMIAGKPYEQHIVSKYYAIENSSNDQKDSELSQLRQHLVAVASQEPYMGEKIPLRWLTFEKSVAEVISKGQHYMNLAKVRELTRDLGVIQDCELFTMLHFYHDLGTIIYFGGEDNSNAYLQDMVILDPKWLIDIFKRIITVMPDQKQWAIFKNKWRRLKAKGILEDHLIDHMWRDLLPHKPALLNLMEMFDLLCPRLDAKEDSQTYYVPACLQPCSEEIVEQESSPVSFYIDFQGFLPDGLFHRLLVHAARWSQQQSGEEPQLYFRYGSFCLDDEHNFQLNMQATSPVCIKVTISKTPVHGFGDNSNVEAQPCPKACCRVKTFLAHTLHELTFTWIQGIRYTFAVACPCNDSYQSDVTLCLFLLDECLNKAKVKCKKKGKKMWVSTEMFKKWFQAKEEEEEDDIDQLKKVNRTLTDVELLELAGEVGTQWKKLGLYLDFRAGDIASLNSDLNHPTIEDKAFQMLIQWHDKISKKGEARGLAIRALKKCGLLSLAETFASPADVQ